MKKYIGIDNSLTSPGIVILSEDGSIDKMWYYSHKLKWDGKLTDKLEGIPYPAYTSEEERIYKLSTITTAIVENEANKGHDVLVAIEGYSFGSTGMRLFQIAENTGLLKNMLWLKKLDFKVVPPTTVKKLATGKGNATKDLMVQEFKNQTRIDLFSIFGVTRLQSPISDIADAYFLAKFVLLQTTQKT